MAVIYSHLYSQTSKGDGKDRRICMLEQLEYRRDQRKRNVASWPIDASVEGLSRVGSESGRAQEAHSLPALILLGKAEMFRVPFFLCT